MIIIILHVSAQSVDERMINVHYYYYYISLQFFSLSLVTRERFSANADFKASERLLVKASAVIIIDKVEQDSSPARLHIYTKKYHFNDENR